METKKKLLLGLASLCLASVAIVAIAGQGITSFFENSVLAAPVNKIKTFDKDSTYTDTPIEGSPIFGQSFAAGNDDFGKAHDAIGFLIENIAEMNEDELSITIGDGDYFIKANYVCKNYNGESYTYDTPVQIANVAFGFNGITSVTIDYSISDNEHPEYYGVSYNLLTSTFEQITGETPLTSGTTAEYGGEKGTATLLLITLRAQKTVDIYVNSLTVTWSC